jgi:hypothetical protein
LLNILLSLYLEDAEEFNEKKALANNLAQKFQKKQDFFKEVNKRKERQRRDLKDENAKRAKVSEKLL